MSGVPHTYGIVAVVSMKGQIAEDENEGREGLKKRQF